MNDLFDESRRQTGGTSQPLADRMRPTRLSELVGQDHLTAEGSLLRTALENDQLFSMILWGPPGCGKTTLAHIIANATGAVFVSLSAVLSGVNDIRKVIDGAKDRRSRFGKNTILFVDEVHRFNKSQQDAFLPHVEGGLITLSAPPPRTPHLPSYPP